MRLARMVTFVAVGAALCGVLASAARARRGRGHRRPRVDVQVTTPVGASYDVVLPVRLGSKASRSVQLEVTWGVDRNWDGRISDDEYLWAWRDDRHPADTAVVTEGRRRRHVSYPTGGAAGAQHAFVWDSSTDVGRGRFTEWRFQHTPTGRRIPDPDSPGSFLIEEASGPLQLRVRALSRRGRPISDWATTEPFELDNWRPPSLAIDDVAAQDGLTRIAWTVRHPESEDANGNGVLDVELGEDRDMDGTLGDAPVAVFFDYHPVYENEDLVAIAAMSPGELDRLDWGSCTRAEDVGDTDALPGGVATAPDGRSYVFAWDHTKDQLHPTLPVILRGRTMDERHVESAFAYWLVAFWPEL